MLFDTLAITGLCTQHNFTIFQKWWQYTSLSSHTSVTRCSDSSRWCCKLAKSISRHSKWYFSRCQCNLAWTCWWIFKSRKYSFWSIACKSKKPRCYCNTWRKCWWSFKQLAKVCILHLLTWGLVFNILSSGTSLIFTSERQKKFLATTHKQFPPIPATPEAFISTGVNSRSTFFGCDPSLSNDFPLIIYLPNAPPITGGNPVTK